MAGISEWINALVEYRQVTLTHRSSKSDSSYGYPFSVIHDKLWCYSFVLGGCLCSIQMSTNRPVLSFCSDVMKGAFLCKGLSQAVTHRCTTINVHTNAEVGVEAHIITQTKKFRCAFCQQSDEHYGGWGLLVISTGYCAMPEEGLGHTVHNECRGILIKFVLLYCDRGSKY
jgi:hypothetical protein